MWHSFGWYSKFIIFMFGNRCKFWPIIEDQHLICFLVTIRDWSYDSMLNADWRFRDVYFWRFWIIRKLWSCKLTNHRLWNSQFYHHHWRLQICLNFSEIFRMYLDDRNYCEMKTRLLTRLHQCSYLFIYWFIHLF